MSEDEGTVYGIRPHRSMTEQESAWAKRLGDIPLTLERANEMRAEFGMEPLTELPHRGEWP